MKARELYYKLRRNGPLGSQHNLAVPGPSTAVGLRHASQSLAPTFGSIRGSQSHESLLSYSTTTHMIDLGSQADLRALHPSVLSTPNCIQISTSSGATKYYQCRTPAERDRWMECLQRTMAPNRDEQRRTENSIQIWILEAKGLPAKRRYFCELCFDQVLYARTSAKPKTDMCFWGEQFEFGHLSAIETIVINVYREPDRRKKKDRCTLIGYVSISVDQLKSRHPVERWYPVISGSTEKTSGVTGWASRTTSNCESTSVRVKARYQSVDVLPLRLYSRLLSYIEHNYLALCNAIEPALSARAKEDFVTSLIRVLHKRNVAKDLLCDLVMAEVANLENDNLMFRGNSLATKAMEAYQKLVADHYLQETLADFVRALLDSDEDCEVDPLKLTDLRQLETHRRQMMYHVEAAWGKIVNSAAHFPSELRCVFAELRGRLASVGRAELVDNLTSASIFLRFLCPAILSPSLFSLCTEYPSDRAARNLTLIAKTLQTLANFSKFSGKEHYMEFMNVFVEREWDNMKSFLQRISSQTSTSPLGIAGSRRSLYGGAIDSTAPIDLGRELAVLHDYLDDSLAAVDPEKLAELRSCVDALNAARADPDAAVDLLLSNGMHLDSKIAGNTPPMLPPLHLRTTHTQTGGVLVSAGDSRNSTIVQVASPTSDYDNNDLTPSDGQTPRFTALVDQRLGNGTNVVDEHLRLRAKGIDVQQDRAARASSNAASILDARGSSGSTRSYVSAADAVTGRVPLTFADESARGSARPLDVSTEDDELATPSDDKQPMTLANGATSSGYHTSSNSASNSSSPVERQPSAKPQPPPNKSHAAHQPLAISNPLYSSVNVGHATVTLNENDAAKQNSLLTCTPLSEGHRRRSTCRSLPDVQQAVVQELQQRQAREHRQPNGVLTPDSSFDSPAGSSRDEDDVLSDTTAMHRSWYNSHVHQQHAKMANGAAESPSLTSSLTPNALQTLLSPASPNVRDSASTSSGTSTSSSSGGGGPVPRHLPRTNPRYTSNIAHRPNDQLYTPSRPPNVGAAAVLPPMLMRRTNTCDVITRSNRHSSNFSPTPVFSKQPVKTSKVVNRPIGGPGGTPYHRAPGAGRRQTADAATLLKANTRPGETAPESNVQVVDRLAELEKELREARLREQSWKHKYEEVRPKWQEQIKPVMDRLQMLETEMKQQMLASQQKQQMIEAQQRRIESLTNANERLNSDLSRIHENLQQQQPNVSGVVDDTTYVKQAGKTVAVQNGRLPPTPEQTPAHSTKPTPTAKTSPPLNTRINRRDETSCSGFTSSSDDASSTIDRQHRASIVIVESAN